MVDGTSPPRRARIMIRRDDRFDKFCLLRWWRLPAGGFSGSSPDELTDAPPIVATVTNFASMTCLLATLFAA